MVLDQLWHLVRAATAKNEANVATTMAALAATAAAHATTAEVVTGLGTTVTDAVADHIGRHIGSLKSDVSSLGQDVIALSTLLANMHGEPPPPAALPTGAPTADGTASPMRLQPLMRSRLCRKPSLRPPLTRHCLPPLG